MQKKISILIPTYNEEKYISSCIDSVLKNDYPKDKIEVFIIDGRSSDKTRDIINSYTDKFDYIKLLDNPHKVVPYALNKGIENASGEIIIRLDAHSKYPDNYFSKLVYWLQETRADNVGGKWVTIPANNTLQAKAIAHATSSAFGVGNAYYRINISDNSPRKVDTVPYGCYRKEVFENIGVFDTDLVRNQDDEFNSRLISKGGKIYLIPDIEIYYYARENLKKMFKMFFQYGLFKPLVNIKVGKPATIRQFVPLFFVLFLFLFPIVFLLNKSFVYVAVSLLLVYFLVNFLVSLKIALHKRILLIFFLPVTFFLIHFSYGIGYLKGIFRFRILKKYNTKINSSR